ncbi:5'-methylthioadenosine/adenosylhomocysteine nucleosidase [Pediococcus ethanolidurans]|uniref:5'-methylthioadenosine/adenosylhomocysteine nucleosidase n=1 Tax=Pediococcus ethanolidurans TaxID=319653 RepID=UPI001C1EB1FA|nr:5'-methylthioadenosine/adenosylhomocysteine nucleosidase [Pediococcus ethanolidurans]MBU7554906.1 5'-methylthioadenosine/adenosylhomocysteine nucleosidase [Pediococcus ethanolidurans]MBU7563455.1 5'-methylthioadenosine/adenosylhomocysteine nucleosidase [Pediococcus ethanolidurans]MCT4397096.1 5'-methylthioadenosine/adenosylhomocysteine nucleosidase [Pediococcus ethanolidurans]MCV3314908.1 5'-methylthioadenosine/adenosylhomocysteine nucleosidase [Pediococcus ethanolidurans]MCV3320719.1 5'-me
MKYGVICAMEEEIKSLYSALSVSNETEINGITFYEGKIQKTDVVLVRSGIGKVEAGITAALLVTNFKVDALIHSGSAGGIGEGLSVGDVVVSTQTLYHDVDATAFGYKLGQLPGQPARFDADSKLITEISEAGKQTGLTIKKGLIVTGDQFISSSDKIKTIIKNFPDALCCEMEGCAIGQVAHQFKVPFVVIRAMSDVGDENAGVSFDDFIIDAGKRSAKMLLALFEN